MKYLMDTNTTSYLVEPENAKQRLEKETRGKMIMEKIREVGNGFKRIQDFTKLRLENWVKD